MLALNYYVLKERVKLMHTANKIDLKERVILAAYEAKTANKTKRNAKHFMVKKWKDACHNYKR